MVNEKCLGVIGSEANCYGGRFARVLRAEI